MIVGEHVGLRPGATRSRQVFLEEIIPRESLASLNLNWRAANDSKPNPFEATAYLLRV